MTFSDVYGQGVSINHNASLPDPSAMLDVQATNKGVVFPRVALVNATDPIAAPVLGLVVFNTTSTYDGAGYYYFNGTDWQALGGGGSLWEEGTGSNIHRLNGDVGIGTPTPNHKLDIIGAANVSESYRLGGVNAIFNNANDIYANIRVLQNNSTVLDDGMYINYNSIGGAGAHLRFFANGTTERVFINANDGSVRINHLAGQSSNKPVIASPDGTLFQDVNPAWQQGAEHCKQGNQETNTDLSASFGWDVYNFNSICFLSETGGQSGSGAEQAKVF